MDRSTDPSDDVIGRSLTYLWVAAKHVHSRVAAPITPVSTSLLESSGTLDQSSLCVKSNWSTYFIIGSTYFIIDMIAQHHCIYVRVPQRPRGKHTA